MTNPLFHDELMTCLACLDTQHANPDIESGWNYITIEGKGFYICPQCWNQPSRIDQHSYLKRLRKLLGRDDD